MKNSQRNQSKFYRSLVATALLAGSFFEFALPVIAEDTAAGQTISNTATATYQDPNGQTINSTSNTVVVTVAEVAGITVEAAGITNVTNPNQPFAPNDTLNYTYTVTNVGNDPTQFLIPNSATVTGPGTAGTVQVSYDNGNNWVDVTDPNFLTNSIPAGGSVLVRVPVTVNAGASQGNTIAVQLGNTPSNGQNLLRDPQAGDVYTVDNADPSTIPGEVNGAPVNGVREASATQQATVNVPTKPYALATVLKTRGTYANQGTPAITDDTLIYGLSLRVESSDPTNNGITPTALVGTNINLNGVPATRILVSDAIPPGTQLAATPTAPPGWQVVYTTTSVATNANEAAWSTTPPPNLSDVTRIGFINIPGTITSVAPGTTVTGFSLQVKVRDNVTATSLTVNNIAQLFGQTEGVPPVVTNPNGVPDNLVYDESGDQNPSNYNNDGTIPPGSTDPDGNGIPNTTPTITDGYINDPTDLTNTGTDPNNNNSGNGPGGEANTLDINAPANLLNGPNNVPGAVGPTDNNDDFTNQSAAVPAGLAPGSTFDPGNVVFTNTVQNNGGSTAPISLVPTPPANPGDLPVGTEVTITANGETRTYVWNGTVFTFNGDPINETSDYITIPGVAPGANVNYTVTVNLPANTPLSTDIDRGFPVPVTAFVDDATPGLQSEPQNTTIDRVYTGFLKLVKESRILQGDIDAPAVQGNDGTFSTDPKRPAPGNIIEYRITYSNISDASAGTGNVILPAGSVVIVEDGTLSTVPNDGKNNWALDNDGNGEIDTSNIVGSAQGSGTINFFSGNPASSSTDKTGLTVDADVTKYENTVGTVQPNANGTFIFRRKVN